MHFAQYLAAGEPAESGGGGPLKAVDMRAFGFHGVPKMMDLVCSVRPHPLPPSSRSTDGETMLMNRIVRDECVYAVYAVTYAYRGGCFTPSGDVQPFVRAECGRCVPRGMWRGGGDESGVD